jgi:hypothetical protein
MPKPTTFRGLSEIHQNFEAKIAQVITAAPIGRTIGLRYEVRPTEAKKFCA